MVPITITEVTMRLDPTDPTRVNVLIKYFENDAPTVALFKEEVSWRTDDILGLWSTWLTTNSFEIT